MRNHNINTHVFCGEKGTGKSNYVMNKWPEKIVLKCEDPLSKLKTASVLENALCQIYKQEYADISGMVFALRSAVLEGNVVIVDCAEFIDAEILKIIVNTLISLESATLIFTFDIDVKALYQNKIFRLLIEWDFVSNMNAQHNFCFPRETYEALIEDALPGVSPIMSSEILEVSGFNFNYLKRLIWLVRSQQSSFERLSESVIMDYSHVMVEEKFSNIPRDMFDVLKKSSVIGEIFQRHVLEAHGGFHIPGVKRYLEELEAMNLFIHSYLSNETYQFMSNQIHAGVLRCIEPEQRIAWEQVLLNYYLKGLELIGSKNEELEHLLQVKRLSLSLNKHQTTYFVNKKLLYRYMDLQDTDKALGILDEIIQYCKQHMDDSELLHFLCFYKIRLNMKSGEFPAALAAINNMKEYSFYSDSLYLQYYYALSLYGNGDVDQSYLQASDLIENLKLTSANALENQPIYALSYSLMATLQHHFGINDHGNKYYVLALNHSGNKLHEKHTYYEILKKCDMYFPYPSSKFKHLESITFFEENGRNNDAAEAYLNVATEMMFNEKDASDDVLAFLQKAMGIFGNTPNWKLAYVKNNLAILYMLYKGDFKTAASLLETALFVGMSSFTYFTIYLNLCMCYLVSHGPASQQFHTANESFNKYHKLISSRQNATQYDDIYKQITDLIILERSGYEDEANARARSILSQKTPVFFTPVLRDIIRRTDSNSEEISTYSGNVNFYSSLNKYKIFLADFRFWE